jgi:GNAT superfamily N-acetyltransferase
MADDHAEDQGQTAAGRQGDPLPDPRQLLAGYEAGPGLLRAAVAGMTGTELRARPVPGKWSTLEVICHLGDTEQFFADRMKRTLAMNRPLLLGADGWLYPDPVRYHDRDPEEELALLTLTRRQMARILRLVPDEAWDRTAVHSEMGLVTLRHLLLHAVRHLQHHLAFIAEKRLALAAAGQTVGDAHEAGPGQPVFSARQGEFLISTDPDLLDVPLIHDFLCHRSYWAAGIPLEVVRRSLANALCFGLYTGGRQVGFARVVTDRATFAWLADVFVLEAYRGRGLSKWLVESVRSHPALQGLRRFLLATRDAHGLYRRYGFTPLADPGRFLEVFRPDIYQAGSALDESE